MATPNDVVAVARSQVGYVESGGAGGNSGNITKYWAELAPSLQGQPWCAAFVSWTFKHAGAPLPPTPWNFGFTYVGAMVDSARQHGWVIPRPVPGAIVCFGSEHTEVCTSTADANGNFGTVGGNTSSGSGGSQVNGGGVYARTRNVNGSGIGPCTFVMPPVYTTQEDDLTPEQDQRLKNAEASSALAATHAANAEAAAARAEDAAVNTITEQRLTNIEDAVKRIAAKVGA